VQTDRRYERGGYLPANPSQPRKPLGSQQNQPMHVHGGIFIAMFGRDRLQDTSTRRLMQNQGLWVGEEMGSRVLGWSLGILLIWSLFILRNDSTTFQQCVSQQAQQEIATQQVKGSASLRVPLLQGRPVELTCTGAFLNGNGPALNAIGTLVIAIFTIVLAIVTNRQAALTKEALIADKRAFVFPIGIQSLWEVIGTEYHWRFKPSWKNSGNTPTKNLTTFVQCEIRSSPLPDTFGFDHDMSEAGPGFLAPGIELLGGQAPKMPGSAISPQDILAAQTGKKFIYLWGFAKYSDVFPSTRPHTTHFCWLLVFGGNPTAFVPNSEVGSGTALIVNYSQWGHGNYAD